MPHNQCVAKSLRLCPSLCDPMDCSLPDPLFMNSPGKNTRVGSNTLLQGIFPIQGLNLGLLHWQVGSLRLYHQRSPIVHTANKMCVN